MSNCIKHCRKIQTTDGKYSAFSHIVYYLFKDKHNHYIRAITIFFNLSQMTNLRHPNSKTISNSMKTRAITKRDHTPPQQLLVTKQINVTGKQNKKFHERAITQ